MNKLYYIKSFGDNSYLDSCLNFTDDKNKMALFSKEQAIKIIKRYPMLNAFLYV